MYIYTFLCVTNVYVCIYACVNYKCACVSLCVCIRVCMCACIHKNYQRASSSATSLNNIKQSFKVVEPISSPTLDCLKSSPTLNTPGFSHFYETWWLPHCDRQTEPLFLPAGHSCVLECLCSSTAHFATGLYAFFFLMQRHTWKVWDPISMSVTTSLSYYWHRKSRLQFVWFFLCGLLVNASSQF